MFDERLHALVFTLTRLEMSHPRHWIFLCVRAKQAAARSKQTTLLDDSVCIQALVAAIVLSSCLTSAHYHLAWTPSYLFVTSAVVPIVYHW
jgi:hypothetical protein